MSSFQFDIFASHNRLQKPWVREAVHQWRTLGLRVFFDEDNICPGENIVAAIENGLKNSHRIVLFVSPSACSSRWVAMETAITMVDDPDGEEGRLIPVLLKPVEQLRDALKIRNLIDLTNEATRVQEYHRLLKYLKNNAPDFIPPDFPFSSCERPFDPEFIDLKLLGGITNDDSITSRHLKRLLCRVIEALATASDSRNPYTHEHSLRVARIAERLGAEMGMSEGERGNLYLMGLLHDIGTIGVEDRVLNKWNKLPKEEEQLFRRHTNLGIHYLAPIEELQRLMPGLAEHHEHYDGSGYPKGKKAKEINLFARILSVADEFDVMSSQSPYRDRLVSGSIKDELQAGSGKKWDPNIIDVAISCYEALEIIVERGIGDLI